MTKYIIKYLIILVPIILIFNCKSPSTAPANMAPVLESLNAPTTVNKGQEYTFSATGYDPDGTKVYYDFHFYTESYSTNINIAVPNTDNHVKVSVSVTLDEVGSFTICCHCKDDEGLESIHVRKYFDVIE